MIVFFLVVIAAILLFGAAAVRGLIGVVLFAIAAIIVGMLLLFWASQIPFWIWASLGVAMLVGGIWASLEDAQNQQEYELAMQELRNAEAELKAADAELAEATRLQAEAAARLARHQLGRLLR